MCLCIYVSCCDSVFDEEGRRELEVYQVKCIALVKTNAAGSFWWCLRRSGLWNRSLRQSSEWQDRSLVKSVLCYSARLNAAPAPAIKDQAAHGSARYSMAAAGLLFTRTFCRKKGENCENRFN